jgi:long-chain acyl-CoA synthetase
MFKKGASLSVFTAERNNETPPLRPSSTDGSTPGDIGLLDEEGFPKITGRKKELLITAGGKNVVPAFLEDRLRAHPLVSQRIVSGDQRPLSRQEPTHPRV